MRPSPTPSVKAGKPHLAFVEELRRRVANQGGCALNLGDFTQTLREFSGNNSKTFRGLKRWIPLEELRETYSDDVDKAVSSLADRRNDFSHFRDNPNLLEEELTRAKEELLTLLGSLRFLTEYPLIQVENVEVDQFREITVVGFRHLQGDHPLVPLESEELSGPPPETGSLYLRDRQGGLHLLRPYLLRTSCKQCGRPEVFHVDRLDPNTLGYRSFEQGHPTRREDQVEPAEHVGLLPMNGGREP